MAEVCFECPICEHKTYEIEEIRAGYCSECGDWTGEGDKSVRQVWTGRDDNDERAEGDHDDD